jgi:hypothetical protein
MEKAQLSFIDQFRFLTLISDQKTTKTYVDAITDVTEDAADGLELDTPSTSSTSSVTSVRSQERSRKGNPLQYTHLYL